MLSQRRLTPIAVCTIVDRKASCKSMTGVGFAVELQRSESFREQGERTTHGGQPGLRRSPQREGTR